MNEKIIKAMAELEEIACEREMAVAENYARARHNLAQAYDEGCFGDLAKRAHEISQRFDV